VLLSLRERENPVLLSLRERENVTRSVTSTESGALYRPDDRGPGAFALAAAVARLDLVLHRLAFLEVVELGSFDRGMVEEDILSRAGNETETTVQHDSLDHTLRHRNNSSHESPGIEARGNQTLRHDPAGPLPPAAAGTVSV
jgi:hypothetical protein